MVEIKLVVEDFGAKLTCEGSFVLGLLLEEYKLLKVVKLEDGTKNFLVEYEKIRFTVSSDTAEILLKLGATRNQNLTC